MLHQTWTAFSQAFDAITGPDAEGNGMLVEDFAVLSSLYIRLVRAGIRFDPLFDAAMSELNRQMQFSDESRDEDVDEDPDEDADRSDLEPNPTPCG